MAGEADGPFTEEYFPAASDVPSSQRGLQFAETGLLLVSVRLQALKQRPGGTFDFFWISL